MSHDLTSSINLAGHLLLAAPSLRDDNFARCAIFLSAHEEEDGAFGYIINRPLHQKVADLMPDKSLGALANVPVHFGGPVATDKLAFASMCWESKRNKLQLHTHLTIEHALQHQTKGHRLFGFVGYSGWIKGQLEQELTHRSWITTTADEFLLHSHLDSELWGYALKNMGPAFGLLATIPNDPELN